MSAQGQDLKIRALPRGNERKGLESQPPPEKGPTELKHDPERSTRAPRWIIYVGSVSVVALLSAFLLPNPAPSPNSVRPSPRERKSDAASVQDPVNAKVSRHLQDLWMKQQIRERRQALDNQELRDPSVSEKTIVLNDDDRAYGVQLDQEDRVEQIYRDLSRRKVANAEMLPDERIRARLEHRKWLNQHERAERINFVRNFLRSAYDRGYQVELDQNLVVVGVKRVTEPRKIDIEQVIDRMARQGL